MYENSQRQSLMQLLAAGSPPARALRPVVLDMGSENAACLAHFPWSLCRLVVLTGSLASARQARRLVECDFVVGRATAMPFASGSLQAIGCFQRFECIVDKETTCREWLRTVHAQGRVLAYVGLTGEYGQERSVTGADWSAYFSQRGLVPERTEVSSPSPGTGSSAYVLLRVPPEERPEIFFSGPFSDADEQRLSADVEERLSLRRAGDLGPACVAAGERGGTLPLAPYLGDADVHAFTVLSGASAPLFARSAGRRATRPAKALLNLPLRLLGRPQGFYNRMVRHALGVCLRVLREVTSFQCLVRNELSMQRAALDRLLNENARLRSRLEEVEGKLGDVLHHPDMAGTSSKRGTPGAQQGDNT